MAIPEEVINEIKYRYDIESVISPYVNLKRRGKNLVGLCPFHNEKTPSFTVYPENGSFYCFGCGVGGDIFSFVRHIENLDYIDAVKQLAERSGVTLPQDGYDDSMSQLKNTIYEINRETAKFFHNYLMSPAGKWALDYFVNSRGLSIATIKHFGLGAAPDGWDNLYKHLKGLGFSDNDMLQAKVVGKSQRGTYYDFFRKRIMCPVINVRGRVVAFSGRAMPGEENGRKYINTSDTLVYKKSENLFGINFAKNNSDERMILVEGNLDVISLHQAGFTNTVGALGTSFTENQAKLLSRYTKELVLTLDADAAGQKAVQRAGEILKDTGLIVKVAVVPDGKDPDEYIRKNGAARFGALIDSAVNIMDYKLLIAAKDIDTENDNGKIEYLNKAIAVVAESNDAVARDVHIGRLSEKYGVSRGTIATRVDELRRANTKRQEKKEIESIIRPRFDKSDVNPERRFYPAGVAAEETVIAVLMQHNDFCESAFKQLPPESMLTSLNRRIYTGIIDCINEGRELDISYFGEMLSPAEMGYLTMLSNSEKGDKNALIVLNDSIRVILDENIHKAASDVKDMSVDDWAENLKKIIETKQKGK